jgi:hypothetical protein
MVTLDTGWIDHSGDSSSQSGTARLTVADDAWANIESLLITGYK